MKKFTLLILLGIIFLAGFLRIWRFTQHDVVTDEVFYGYRSIALIDSLNSPFQSTPFEWFEKIPWWAHFSFHDHPPLGFWIQHAFFAVLGGNLFAMRLPFALAGVGAVLLIYFIARRLFRNETVALASAGLLAVSNYHVWISRIGLQESLVIFFMLLTIHFFLKSLEAGKFFYWTIGALGLAFLMKYISIVLLPVFLIYWYFRKREVLTVKRLAIGAVLFLAVISPVIVYNIGLYAARGHFDFQISYFLKQQVPEWAVRPGREVGTFWEKFYNFFKNFWQYGGAVMVLTAVLAAAGVVRRRKEAPYFFVGLTILFLLLLFLVVGPQERFLSLLAPFWAMALAATLLGRAASRFRYVLLGLFVVLELALAFNTNLKVHPVGSQGMLYTLLRRESNIWGYNQLDDYFTGLMAGRYPKANFPLRFAFTRPLQEDALRQAREQGRAEDRTLFVVDSRVHGPAFLWYFTRRTVYERWPVIEDQNFLTVAGGDLNFFTKQGFDRIVYFQTADTLKRGDIGAEASEAMVKLLTDQGVQPETIVSRDGHEAFKVFIFQTM